MWALIEKPRRIDTKETLLSTPKANEYKDYYGRVQEGPSTSDGTSIQYIGNNNTDHNEPKGSPDAVRETSAGELSGVNRASLHRAAVKLHRTLQHRERKWASAEEKWGDYDCMKTRWRYITPGSILSAESSEHLFERGSVDRLYSAPLRQNLGLPRQNVRTSRPNTTSTSRIAPHASAHFSSSPHVMRPHTSAGLGTERSQRFHVNNHANTRPRTSNSSSGVGR